MPRSDVAVWLLDAGDDDDGWRERAFWRHEHVSGGAHGDAAMRRRRSAGTSLLVVLVLAAVVGPRCRGGAEDADRTAGPVRRGLADGARWMARSACAGRAELFTSRRRRAGRTRGRRSSTSFLAEDDRALPRARPGDRRTRARCGGQISLPADRAPLLRVERMPILNTVRGHGGWSPHGPRAPRRRAPRRRARAVGGPRLRRRRRRAIRTSARCDASAVALQSARGLTPPGGV